MKQLLITVLLIAVVIGGIWWWQNREVSIPPNVPSGPITHKDLIRIDIPLSNTQVVSPFKVTGAARGNWYFEASFPVELLDGNGRQIAILSAQAQGEWMTTEFVPFSVTLTFTKPTTTTGTLILRKDNPSGLLEHDDSVSIPVRF